MPHWHIAIESSGRRGSLALLDGERPLRQLDLPADQGTAASFAVALEDLLQPLQRSGESLQLVSVSDGPGSFTGLRIGVTAAKTLAYAMNCQLVAVDALHMIADQCFAQDASVERLWVGIKAYRGQVFARQCERQHPQAQASMILSGEDWVRRVAASSGRWGLAGDACEYLGLENSPEIFLFERAVWQPRATTVGQIGAAKAAAGHTVEPLRLVPNYLRPSAAEEKQAENRARF